MWRFLERSQIDRYRVALVPAMSAERASIDLYSEATAVLAIKAAVINLER